jgi:hypothetical protein
MEERIPFTVNNNRFGYNIMIADENHCLWRHAFGA